MPFLIDPRSGDFEDDTSSTEQRPMLALAGSMLAELSLIKLAITWLILVAFPALILGLAVPLLSAWLSKVSDKAVAFTGLGSAVLLTFLGAVAWFGLRPMLRAAESNFWALHSIVVQPFYALVREGIRHVAEASMLARSDEAVRAKVRAYTALVAAAFCVMMAYVVVRMTWPYTRWDASLADLTHVTTWIIPAIANAIVLITFYFALFSLISGLSDATMDQPMRIVRFDDETVGEKPFRVAHISDLHAIGEPYGFRIESGRAGAQGNDWIALVFEELDSIDRADPLDLILITGDLTDAGRSAEWAAFFDVAEAYPGLLAKTLIAPGNHDINIVDRANPARLELPVSAYKRLRQMRTLSAMERIQGSRTYVFDRKTKTLGQSLSEAIKERRAEIDSFLHLGSFVGAYKLAPFWADCFPLIAPPITPDGLGVVILNSNANTNFSFTNALGMIAAEDVAVLTCIMKEFPQTRWIIALHHHLVEYPMRVKCFSERIGTSLINGGWFIRQLKPFAPRIVIMHGHRHIDWIGSCGDLKIVSAPSPVMEKPESEPCFLVHTLLKGASGSVGLAAPKRHNMRDAAAPRIETGSPQAEILQ
jgi:predicted MPP superfamily phosphohydrolase